MCGLIALALGLASANIALDRGFAFQEKTSGSWSGWLHATAPEADPYTQAHFGRNGILPPPPNESLVFISRQDTAGNALAGSCSYEISGAFPPARRWTMTVYDTAGQLIANPANRFGFSNRTVLFNGDGTATITLSAAPRPGNWLPLDPDRVHILALAFYDTPLARDALLSDPVLPAIRRTGCAP